MTFQSVPSRTSPAQREQQVLDFWRQSGAFAQSQQLPGRDFVFFEGPPTANGRPHIGHMIPRALKDLFARFQTMTGHRVLRKAGWDTHGLPVELEVEKELGLSGKPQVEAYGVGPFTQKCRESVWRYKAEWESTATERIGYWLDTEQPYVTYTDEYVESVWWALKRFWEQGLLYQGHKVVPYCPRCGTALSSHEVAQGYQEVEDPALVVRFPVTSPGPLQGVSLLAWTTTPWTLPANLALAVRPDAVYAVAAVNGERVLMLRHRLPADAEVVAEVTGAELEGLTYEPPFPYAPSEGAHRVLTAPWVAVDEGTGVVHIAPAFGEDDSRLGAEHGLPFFCPVDDQGKFTEAVSPWQGKFVKQADPDVTRALAEAGKLYEAGKVMHTYPFCWRCDTPLLYMARAAWFLRTTALKDDLLKANAGVTWHPDHFRDGRFGNFLENVIDWCLSRERYWGTPLPLWQCGGCGHRHVVGSYAELAELAGCEVTDVHRPGIDAVELTCPYCGGRMRRVPEVVDCWFDSGCMPFAQHHYPFENADLFAQQFPADFICEAVDQTRGWFYSLLVVSVGLFGKAPYRRVLVTDFGLDERGKKMSKSRKNVVDLGEVLAQYGADGLRFYVYSSGHPWLPKRISKAAVGEAGRVLETLQNVYSFFVLYANLDGWTPDHAGAVVESPLDRWLNSRLQTVTAEVRQSLEAYDVARGARALAVWVDDLSNWYVRLNRRRFWNGGDGAAFATLHWAMVQTSLLMAPFTPFLAETVYQNLTSGRNGSVHLQPFPESEGAMRDEHLEYRMDLLRRYASAGRAARQKAGLKVRQPLAALVLLGTTTDLSDLTDLLKGELNVRTVLMADEAPDGFVTGEDGGCLAAVDPVLTPDLLREGLAREVVNRLQRYRKELGLAVEDRVTLRLDGSPELLAALAEHREYVAGEVQAVALTLGPLPEGAARLDAAFDGQQLAAVVTLAAPELTAGPKS
ncbi:MAG TPA: isoleucine--tRNA ligase [Symbiobacteriaceae bacterium]|nr:isoleucine--tRNA ligase [Symbiobacteriaceae bacterium]